jgi:hypothetical protein
MKKTTFISLFKDLAIAGNVIFILWITYNGINEGFKGTLVQIFSYIGLTLLLILNSILLLRKEPGAS